MFQDLIDRLELYQSDQKDIAKDKANEKTKATIEKYRNELNQILPQINALEGPAEEAKEASKKAKKEVEKLQKEVVECDLVARQAYLALAGIPDLDSESAIAGQNIVTQALGRKQVRNPH